MVTRKFHYGLYPLEKKLNYRPPEVARISLLVALEFFDDHAQ